MGRAAGPYADRLAALAGAPDRDVALAETALAIAAPDHPEVRVDTYLARCRALASGLGGRQAAERGRTLAATLADHVTDAEDADADDLIWVLDHRRGGPMALGILALEAARAAGWTAEGLAFPGHFLIRVEDEDGGRAIVDPGARRLADPPALRALLKAIAGIDAELRPELWTALGNRDILIRLQNDAKMRALRAGRVDKALAAVEAVLLFAPGHAELWREAGLMHVRLGNVAAAVSALEQFVSRTPEGLARRRVLQMLQDLRARLT
ncbi:MAG: SirB1 family protein [Solirubrobacterales bacterium]